MSTSTPRHDARIAQIEPAALDQSLLTLEHDPVLEAAYTRAGQYCQLRLEPAGIEGYFVLVDPPGTGPLRFLLRAGGTAADALSESAVGTAVTVRGPLGRGFPIEKAMGRDVLLVSAGSGIAAIRPLVLSLPPSDTRRVWLFHGTRTLEHIPFVDDLEHAEHEGLRLTVTVSRDDAGTLGERVQHAIHRAKLDLSNAVAFVSGMQPMIDALREELPHLGLAAEDIYLNY